MTGLPVNEALVNAVQACCNWHHAPEESKAATDAGYPCGFGDNLTIFTGAGDDTGRIQAVLHREPRFLSGSTDCNIPLSLGIPAICIGVCRGGGCHTREEWLDTQSLLDGCRILMELFQYYLQQSPAAN